MADINKHFSSWLKRRKQLRQARKLHQDRKNLARMSPKPAMAPGFKRAPGPAKPRWLVVVLGLLGLIFLGTIGSLVHFAFFPPPPTEKVVVDRRPEQHALCETLVKQKLSDPGSYEMVSGFSETGDDGAKRTFNWTFSSRNRDGGTGKGSAICKANNHLKMAEVAVKQLE